MGRHEHVNQTDLDGLKKRTSTTTDPTVNDDGVAGYAVASRWYNTTSDEEFVCLDSSTGAAVWKSTTATGETMQSANAAGAVPVDGDVAAWPAVSVGIVTGTGGRIWLARKNATDVYFVELSAN